MLLLSDKNNIKVKKNANYIYLQNFVFLIYFPPDLRFFIKNEYKFCDFRFSKAPNLSSKNGNSQIAVLFCV